MGRLGRHVPLPSGFAGAVRQARDAGYDAVQVFPGNPKGWYHAPLPEGAAERARASAHDLEVAPVVIHAPYIINVATDDDALAAKSARALTNALDRAGELGARYVVVHAGSHKGAGEESGIARVARLIELVLPAAPPGVELLIENSAGAGNVLAGTPAALGRLLATLPPEVGTCVDTAHLWGGGSDLADAQGVERTLDELDAAAGLARIKVIHLNDSAVALGSHRDVHARLGEGTIGLAGLTCWTSHPTLRDHLVILETPLEDDPNREARRCTMARLLRDGDLEGATEILDDLRLNPMTPRP